MDPKEKIDSLKYYSQVHRSQFDERRKYEWRIFGSALTFYVLSVAAIYSGEADLPKNIPMFIVVWVWFIVLAFFTWHYLKGVHKAHAENKLRAEWAENRIVELIQGRPESAVSPDDKPESRISYLGKWSLRSQTVILFGFATTAAFFITVKLLVPGTE